MLLLLSWLLALIPLLHKHVVIGAENLESKCLDSITRQYCKHHRLLKIIQDAPFYTQGSMKSYLLGFEKFTSLRIMYTIYTMW